MNEKTMRKWFKTFLMILPFLFLAIFAIGARAKGLEYYPKNSDERSELTQIEYYDTYTINLLDTYNEEDGYGYFYLSYTAYDWLAAARTPNRYAEIGMLGGDLEVRINTLTRAGSIRQSSTGNGNSDAANIPGVSDLGILSFTVDEVLDYDLYYMLEYGADGATNEIEVGIYYELDLELLAENPEFLIFNPFESSNIEPSKMTFRAVEPITGVSAAFYSFNDMIDEVMNFNAFGMNDFYDWMNENWFNNEAPLIVKPVFTLLVYEAIIELIFLMFSFITFVIRFAQQWIDGFYTKGGGK